MTIVPRHPRATLEQIFQGALAAVSPGPAVRRALDGIPLDSRRWLRLLALGKAAVPMATAAAEWLRTHDIRLRDGLVVPTAPASLPDPAIRVVPGDHPTPGRRSAQAAAALDRFVSDGRAGDVVLVLLSGGTSSLVAAPVEGLTAGDFQAIHRLLSRTGLPISETNRLRRRFGRWAGGRLAAQLAPAEMIVLAISDVPGDHLADIGSGPCSPDPDSAESLRAWLTATGLWSTLPRSARAVLDATATGRRPDTHAGPSVFEHVSAQIVAANADALRGARETATRLGLRATVETLPLAGEAAEAGHRIAAELRASPAPASAICRIWGGETVVRLPEGHTELGGRSQELALAAAGVLASKSGSYPALLAAGTDGLDGRGDAAGAVVDPSTWRRIIAAGYDPGAALAAHRSHAALAAAGALLYTGPTGTNVMDLVIGLRD